MLTGGVSLGLVYGKHVENVVLDKLDTIVIFVEQVFDDGAGNPLIAIAHVVDAIFATH